MLSTTLRTGSRFLRRPLLASYSRPRLQTACYLSTGEHPDQKKDSLRDTVNRLKGEEKDAADKSNEQVNDLLRRAADVWDKVKTEVGKTWHELVNAGKPKDINKKIHPVETEEGNKEYTGPVEIMVIDESEHLTAWERMQRRLTEAPIIQGQCVSCDTSAVLVQLLRPTGVSDAKLTPSRSHGLQKLWTKDI